MRFCCSAEKQVKRFERFYLEKGEEQQITFVLTGDELSIVNSEMKSVVEPENFRLMIGSSSDNIRLTGVISEK